MSLNTSLAKARRFIRYRNKQYNQLFGVGKEEVSLPALLRPSHNHKFLSVPRGRIDDWERSAGATLLPRRRCDASWRARTSRGQGVAGRGDVSGPSPMSAQLSN
jgi:hypothetical protein